MQDMLVKLYDLPDITTLLQRLKEENYTLRHALAAEKKIVKDWVHERYGSGWASEAEVCFSFQPVACMLALKNDEIIGFACYDAACRNFFGPTAVVREHRRRGLGRALLVSCLTAMRLQGYAYAIIGGVGPAAYYERTVGAVLIEGSNPGIYRGLLSHVPVP